MPDAIHDQADRGAGRCDQRRSRGICRCAPQGRYRGTGATLISGRMGAVVATATGTWSAVGRGLADRGGVGCLTMHLTQPGVVFAGTQAGPYRSTDAGDTWERLHFPGDEPVVWSFEIHPADARVMYAGTQDMAVYRSEDGGEHGQRLTVPTNPDGLSVMGFPTPMIWL